MSKMKITGMWDGELIMRPETSEERLIAALEGLNESIPELVGDPNCIECYGTGIKYTHDKNGSILPLVCECDVTTLPEPFEE